MNEETMEIEETTTEPVTLESTTTILVTSSETSTVTAIVDVGEGYPDYSENPLHELFDMLGVNLEYVPKNPYQCFSMACSVIVALWFIIWFCKFLLALSKDLFK